MVSSFFSLEDSNEPPWRLPWRRSLKLIAQIFLIISLICIGSHLFGAIESVAEIKPIRHNGVLYDVSYKKQYEAKKNSAFMDGLFTAYIVAVNERVKPEKELWRVAIYRAIINGEVEEDVQWVFAEAFVKKENELLVQTGYGDWISINISTHEVKPGNIEYKFHVPRGYIPYVKSSEFRNDILIMFACGLAIAILFFTIIRIRKS